MSNIENSISIFSDEETEETREIEEFSESSSNILQKYKGGRKFTSVWNHITKGKEVSRGHYEGTCNYCNLFWSIAKPFYVRTHLASHCNKCPESVSLEFSRLLLEESNKRIIKKQQTTGSEQTTQFKISTSQQNNINNALIKAFVCCNISFLTIENPFFIEFLKVLNKDYNPPSRKTLSTTLLEQEVNRINTIFKNDIKYIENLTLGKYY
jgi:hypothetical protein